MIKKKIKASSTHAPDLTLLGALAALIIFGLVMVYDSAASSQTNLAIRQFSWAVLGILLGAVLYRMDYRRLKGLALPIFLGTVLLLVLVLLPTPLSQTIRGNRNWIGLPLELPVLGNLSIQPSELAKFSLIIYLAALFTGKRKGVGENAPRPRIWSLLIPLILVAGLIALEKDIGTLMIVALLGISLLIYIGATFKQVILLIFAAAILSTGLFLTSPTALTRIKAYLNPDSYALQENYQINQVLIAIGSGGFWGLGLGKSVQKNGYIPDISTDAIFAIVGEETGFLGATILVGLMAFIVYRGFLIALSAPDEFSRIVAAGVSSWFGLQVLINLMTITRILPLTGVPLPLVSYGGSALVTMLAAFGVVLNISRFASHKAPRMVRRKK